MGELATPATLWLMAVPEDHFRTLRAIRTALEFFGQPHGMSEAQEVLDTFKSDRFAYLGTSSDAAALRVLQDELADMDCGTAQNIDHERWARAARSRKMTDSGSTPEEVFAVEAPGTALADAEAQARKDGADLPREAYETAIALLASVEGNPLRAAATAHSLTRTTGNPELYRNTIKALVSTFFWLRQLLSDQGIKY